MQRSPISCYEDCNLSSGPSGSLVIVHWARQHAQTKGMSGTNPSRAGSIAEKKLFPVPIRTFVAKHWKYNRHPCCEVEAEFGSRTIQRLIDR